MKIRRSLTSSVNSTFSNIFFISLIFFRLSPCFCEDSTDEFKACGIVYSCGDDVVNISYPFWGNERREICGRPEFELKCEGNQTTTIEIDSTKYKVLKIDKLDRRMSITRLDLFDDLCRPENYSKPPPALDDDLFKYSSNDLNISVWYDCPRQANDTAIEDFWCEFNARSRDRANYFSKEPIQTMSLNPSRNIKGCRMNITVTVTVDGLEGVIENGTKALEKALKRGFDIEYGGDLHLMACDGCKRSGGNCAANETYPFYCHCQKEDVHPYVCLIPERPSRSRLLIIYISVTLGSTFLIATIIIFGYYRMKRMSSKEKEIEKTIRKYATQTLERYSYSKLKKITKSFKNKLGQGGFSSVYKGTLPDGRDVAVKILNESTGNGQDFINEVISISKTSHVNVVTLLGFCFEQKKRALIFEYMPKGSLDKYIFQKGLLDSDAQLNWTTLYRIVVGIARGLEYLHRGCNTRILHFDIKPHNILLDDDFCPKITDFGLAKQCQAKESHVSLTCTKGTVGFIAPEVIFRNIGKVSHKSDVYSYGMLILEMVGERKNPNQGMSKSSDEYFPDWIYKDLTETRDIDGGFCWANTKEEEEIARKMIMVGMHCIQIVPDDRPSMSDVVSMLEGSLDCLQMPPKPTLFSPHRQQAQASSSSAS